MALPIVKTAADCADFSKTILPFISQLTSLPSRLVEAGTDVDTLKHVYLNTNPFITAVAFSLFLVPVFLIASEVNKNYSQVDRFWSILPSVYVGHFAAWAHLNGLPGEIIYTILTFSLVWSARLTFNYWRRGGYNIGSEDYRWGPVRARLDNGLLRFAFVFLFVCLTQSIVLLLITAPTYIFLLLATVPGGYEFATHDLLFSRILIFFVFVEYFADQQQWRFQNAKKAYQASARVPPKLKNVFTIDDLNRGFVVTGLWSWCRHPNFAAEQAIWLTFYLWACYDTETYFNWSGIGAVGLVLIFQGSTRLTEEISASKYPEYKEYQARVAKFIPRLSLEPRRAWKVDGSPNPDQAKKDTQKVKKREVKKNE